MAVTLSLQTRRELIQQMVPRYREASVSHKGVLLDEIAATTGYARRYAMWLLNHTREAQQPHGLAGGNGHLGRRSNTPCFWLGRQPIVSVASGSCHFCPP